MPLAMDNGDLTNLNPKKGALMQLNESKNTLRLDIQGELDTHQVEKLLVELATMRAKMKPAVPMSWDEAQKSEVLPEENSNLFISRLSAGGFRLWALHRGYGWICYTLDNRMADGLAAYISGEPINLISSQNMNWQ